MMSITPIGAGEGGLNYLLEQTGCPVEHEHRDVAKDGRHAGAEYLIDGEERGEPVGRWLGTGLDEFGLTAGQEADEATIRALFGRLEDPVTGEQLGRAPYKFKTPEARLKEALAAEPDASPERVAELTWQMNGSHRQAVGYFDITMSPVKSVSLYYAGLLDLGRVAEAEIVWRAHREAVDAAFAYMEQQAGFSRAGYHGRTKDGRSVGEYVPARHWVGARFDHSTNREHEPQLHSHAIVLNRTRCEEDGVWRTLDSRAMYHEKRGSDAVYELTLEQAVIRDGLPIEFAIRPDGKAREIVGITEDQRKMVSTRREQVVARVEEKIVAYQELHGRNPSAYELTMMHSHATKETRAPKTGKVTAEELKATWAVHSKMLREAVAAAEARHHERGGPPEAAPIDRDAITRAAIHQVQQARSTWTRSDLMLAMKQQLPGRVAADDGPAVQAFLTGLADDAVRPGSGFGLLTLTAPEPVPVPAELTRQSDGRPVFRPHRDERYCTEDQLAAEERLLAKSYQLTAPRLTPEQLVPLEAALVARGLNDGQRAFVLGAMGSGRALDGVIGPAGSGKSYAMGSLQEAWESYFGPVLGLATGQAAANILAEEGLPALNIAQFLARYEADPRTGLPSERLTPGSLLVVDESGTSATEQLDKVMAIAAAAGAKTIAAGDHEQNDSVGAGGFLRLLAETGRTFDLTEVRRFAEDWERAASLQIRAGDRAGLRAYDDRGRIFEGSRDQMLEMGYQSYLADTLMGKRSLLLVGSNEDARTLSMRARAEMVRLGKVEGGGALLRDGNLAGKGDLIQTRQGNRNLRSADGTHWVANRDVWEVTGRTDEGLQVRLQDKPNVTLTLPPEYVEKDVTLAYATTSFAAQGRTVHTGHNVVDVTMSRGQLYPNLTRGAESNWLYTVTRDGPDDERGNQPFSSDRVSVLSEVLERDTAQRAATQVLREEAEAVRSLASMGTVHQHAVYGQAVDRYSDALLGLVGPERMDALAKEPGVGRLWRSVRTAELAGHDPSKVLAEAVERGGLDDAESWSDVLRWRVNTDVGAARGEVSTWAGRTPEVDTEIGRYTAELATLMDERQEELGRRLAADPPQWAKDHLGAVPESPQEQEEWVKRAGVVEGWRELANVPEGKSVLGAAPSREMPDRRAAWNAAYSALGADEALRDYAAAPDAQLEAAVAKHEREKEWAPAYVAPRLREAQQHATTYSRHAILWGVAAQTATDPKERDEKQARADQRAEWAAREGEVAEKLTKIYNARELWSEHTADSAHAAEMSQRELTRRMGIDPDAMPAPEAAPNAGSTHADVDASVERAQEATERILAQREAQRQEGIESGQRLLDDEPQHAGMEHSTPERVESAPSDGGGMER